MGKVCGVFPGQGNSYVGMGEGLYDRPGIAKRMCGSASDTSGVDVVRVSLEGSAKEQSDPLNSQLITFTNSCILYELSKDKFDFGCFAGHSIGELAALYATGVFGEGMKGFWKGVKIVTKRGELMGDYSSKESCLISVLGCGQRKIEEFCESTGGDLSVALYNNPGNYVVGGTPESIKKWSDEFHKWISKVGAKKVELAVMGPYHTDDFRVASEYFDRFLRGLNFNEPRVTTYANWNAEPYSKDTIIDGLVKQLWNPVLWEDIVRKVPFDKFVEIGPGKSLSGMIRRIRRDSRRVSVQGLDDL